jgi:hypothetical protein
LLLSALVRALFSPGIAPIFFLAAIAESDPPAQRTDEIALMCIRKLPNPD